MFLVKVGKNTKRIGEINMSVDTELKNRKRRNITLPNELDEWLSSYCEKKGASKTRVIERALLLLKKEMEESREYSS